MSLSWKWRCRGFLFTSFLRPLASLLCFASFNLRLRLHSPYPWISSEGAAITSAQRNPHHHHLLPSAICQRPSIPRHSRCDLTMCSSDGRESRARTKRAAADSPADRSDPENAYISPNATDTTSQRESKRRSPSGSLEQHRGSSPSTPGNRSRARPLPSIYDGTKRPSQPSNRKLWTSDSHASARQGPQLHSQRLSRPGGEPFKSNRFPQKNDLADSPFANDENATTMSRELDTRPISQEQLVSEVKGIYAALVMVESKCIEFNNQQSKASEQNSGFTQEQWQALIALHRTLLHEHHDFFLASQHPSANPALKRLASKYAMPARMWRHGIHSFLELLRHRLPESREYMLSFVYLAYSTMALLYETVPTFEETWIECLGDLSRYRMAIEEDDIRDREIWTGVSRHWYSKASEKAPSTGRLYHHLAILARPNALHQLFCYSKSLCVMIPFTSAKESIVTLFEPLLTSENPRLFFAEASFVRVQGVLFTNTHNDKLATWREDFLKHLDGHIGRTARRWLESGYFIGISLACSLLGFGDENNVLMRAISQKRPDEAESAMESSMTLDNNAAETFAIALDFAVKTWSIVIRRWGDMNTLPSHHTMLVFMLHMIRFPSAITHLESKFPWKLTATMLNYLLKTTKYRPNIETEDFTSFAAPMNEQHRPLPDDYALRGLVYAEEYLPKKNFPENIAEDEKYFEQGSMTEERIKRIVWLGFRLARSKRWLTWDPESDKFGCHPSFDLDIDEGPWTTPEESRAPSLDRPLSPVTLDD